MCLATPYPISVSITTIAIFSVGHTFGTVGTHGLGVVGVVGVPLEMVSFIV